MLCIIQHYPNLNIPFKLFLPTIQELIRSVAQGHFIVLSKSANVLEIILDFYAGGS